MSVILGILAAFLSGFLAILLLPLIARALGGREGAEIVAQQYFDMAAKLYGRLLLVLREGGGLDLVKSSHDAGIGLEKATLDGEDKHFEDPHNYMSRFYKVPFGIADEARGVIVNPRISELGELVKARREEGMAYTDGGTTFFEGVLPITTDKTRLVHPKNARTIITGSATADLADKVDAMMEISQSRFNTSPTVQYLVWLGGLVAGFGLMLIAFQMIKTTGGAPDPGRDVGIPTIVGALVGVVV